MAKNKQNSIDSFAGMFKGGSEIISNEPTESTKTESDITVKKKGRVGRPKNKAEIKVIKTISMYPSVIEKLKKISQVERTSESEVIAKLIVKYFAENEEKIEEIYRLLNNISID